MSRNEYEEELRRREVERARIRREEERQRSEHERDEHERYRLEELEQRRKLQGWELLLDNTLDQLWRLNKLFGLNDGLAVVAKKLSGDERVAISRWKPQLNPDWEDVTNTVGPSLNYTFNGKPHTGRFWTKWLRIKTGNKFEETTQYRGGEGHWVDTYNVIPILASPTKTYNDEIKLKVSAPVDFMTRPNLIPTYYNKQGSPEIFYEFYVHGYSLDDEQPRFGKKNILETFDYDSKSLSLSYNNFRDDFDLNQTRVIFQDFLLDFLDGQMPKK